MEKIPNSIVCLAGFILLAAYFLATPAVLNDPDTAWHLAAGDLFRTLRGVTVRDPWSFTSGTYPWYDISWAWDILFSMVVARAGLGTAVALTVVFSALIVTLNASFLFARSRSPLATAVVGLLVGVIIADGVLLRPHLVSYFLVLVFGWICYRLRRGEAVRLRWLLPLLMVVWVNMHGAYPAGFTILGAYFIDRLAAGDWAGGRRFFLIGVLCLVAVFINPVGWHVFEAALRSVNGPLRQIIYEWRSLDFGENIPALIYLTVLLIAGRFRDRDIPLADKLLTVTWLVMALFHVRYLMIFVLVSSPFLALSLKRWVDASVACARKDADWFEWGQRRGLRLAALLLLGGGALLVLSPAGQDLAWRGRAATFPAHQVPLEAIRFVQTAFPGRRFLSHYDYGGYIIYYTRGGVKTFIDGRAETAAPPHVVRDYLTFTHLLPGWETLAARYGLFGFMVPRDSRYSAVLDADSQWQRVFSDHVAVVYVRVADKALAGTP